MLNLTRDKVDKKQINTYIIYWRENFTEHVWKSYRIGLFAIEEIDESVHLRYFNTFKFQSTCSKIILWFFLTVLLHYSFGIFKVLWCLKFVSIWSPFTFLENSHNSCIIISCRPILIYKDILMIFIVCPKIW